MGNATTYGYTAGLLTSIVDPSPRTGVTPTTTLGYSSLQTTSVKYSTSATTNNEYDFGYTTSPTTGVCNGADRSVAVTDPRSNTTHYCVSDRTEQSGSDIPTGGDTVVDVYDGLNNHRSTSYSADGNAYTNTTAGNGSTNPSINGYDATTSALNSMTAPTNTTGDTAAASHIAYGNKSTSIPGGDFNPTSVQTSDTYCTAYVYDSTGDLTDSYPGLNPSGSDCTGQTNANHYGADYNSDGTVADSFDPNGSRGSTPDETVFTYATSGDTRGDLTQKVAPGGSCTSGSRNLCTQYTYDNLSRPVTMTDGNNNTTTYSYDKNDEITQVLLNGTSTCNTAAGTCITYSYDAEGNLTQRVDGQGTTTFGFDWLNRQTSQITPDGTEVDYGYDGAGNVTTYAQQLTGHTADTVTYLYDAADHYTKVTDATGATTVSENSDGKPSVTTFPSGTGVSFTDTYAASGKARAITPSAGSGLPTVAYGYGYTGGTSERDQSQKQTTTTSGTAVSQTYTYGPAGRLTNVAFSDSTPTRHYSYDGAGNLASSANGSTNFYYGYNEDNQWCWSGTAASAPATQIARACPSTPTGYTAYTADKAGNFTGTTAGPITYNANNQATSLTDIGGGTAVAQSYLDQGNDLRVTAGGNTFVNGVLGVTARKNTGGITYYTRDPNGHLIDEHGSSGTGYYYADRQHTILNIIGSTGTITATYTYSPYGKPTGTGTASADNPWRYTGGYYDIEGDHYSHLGARYYTHDDHFTQPDPNIGTLANPQTANGDPIDDTDQRGRFDLGDLGSAVAQAFSAAGGSELISAGGDIVDAALEDEFIDTLATIVGVSTGSILIVGGVAVIVGVTIVISS